MNLLDVILMLLACVCFGVAAFGFGVGKLNLIALGLLFWAFDVFLHTVA